jgi:hypothetical protein
LGEFEGAFVNTRRMWDCGEHAVGLSFSHIKLREVFSIRECFVFLLVKIKIRSRDLNNHIFELLRGKLADIGIHLGIYA